MPPPAKGSWKAGSLSGSNSSAALGWSLLSSEVRRQLLRISSRAAFQDRLVGGVLPLHQVLDDAKQSLPLLGLGFVCGEQLSGREEGSSTSWAKSTARAVASGRRAHQRWRVLGWPCRIDFSRADAALMASSGRATSMRLLADHHHFSCSVNNGKPDRVGLD